MLYDFDLIDPFKEKLVLSWQITVINHINQGMTECLFDEEMDVFKVHVMGGEGWRSST